MTCQAAWVLGFTCPVSRIRVRGDVTRRHTNRLYVTANHQPADTHHGGLAPAGDPIVRLARSLQRDRHDTLATDQTGLSTLADDELREQLHGLRDRALEVLRRDRTHRRLTEKRVQLADRRDTIADQLRNAQTEADDRRGLLTRRPPVEHRQRVQRLRNRLDDTEEELAQVTDEIERTAPQPADDEVLVRFEACHDELQERAIRAARVAEHVPPVYVAAAIGKRPDNPAERARWRQAAATVEALPPHVGYR